MVDFVGLSEEEDVVELWIWYSLVEDKHHPFLPREPMVALVLNCPYCDGVDLVRHGKSPQGRT